MAAESLKCAQIDNTFGPWAGDCRGGFDFTLLFEESILTIPILCLLIIATPLRVLHLMKRRKKILYSVLVIIKLASLVVYTVLQVTLLALWARNSSYKSKLSVATAALNFVAASSLCILTYFEHFNSVKPSIFISSYVLFSLLFDTARARTLWLIGEEKSITIIFTATVALKFAIFGLESIKKTAILAPGYTDYPPEVTSGLLAQYSFFWLNRMMIKGFKHILAIEDLDSLDNHLKSRRVNNRLMTNWENSDQKRKHDLVYVIVKTMKWPIAAGVLSRLSLIGFTFAQPFLINRAIDLSTSPENPENKNVGYGLIGAYILVYTGIAVSTGHYTHKTNRVIVMVRGGLVSAIYKKTLGLKIADAESAAAITLMSTDVERIAGGCSHIQETWANVIEAGIAIYLIERKLGIACIIPVICALVSAFATIKTSASVAGTQLAWILAIQHRVKSTATVLESVKSIKLSGLTEYATSIIHNLRVTELDVSKKMRRVLVKTILYNFATPIFIPLLAFMVAALISQARSESTLTVATIYTSLSLFYLLISPLNTLLTSIPNIAAAIACCDRIQEYLVTESHQDPRKWSETSKSDSQLQETTSGYSSRSSNLTAIQKETTISQPSISGDDMLKIQNGSFGWGEAPLLSDVNIRIQSGYFVVIVGPLGSGKTTLVKGILGELPFNGQSLSICSPEVAYCEQTPWLPNETIRMSILGDSDFDPELYRSVLHACALEEDLYRLPQGDQMRIGSKGVTLSGGQKQRLALARAIYSRKQIVILDDVLSGLDADTEHEVFHRILGSNGLLRRHGRTVILATSSDLRVPYADHIIVLGEGKIVEQGSFPGLNSSTGRISSLSLSEPDWTYERRSEGKEYNEHAESDSGATTNSATSDNELSAAAVEANRNTGDLTVYKYYLSSVKLLLLISFSFGIITFVFGTAFPEIWVKWWSEANAYHPNANLGKWLGVYAALASIALIAIVGSCWLMFIEIIPQSGLYFHTCLLETVSKAKISFFWETDTGVILNKFSQDLMFIDMELPMAALLTLIAIVTCVAQLVLIAVAVNYIAIAFPFALGLFYCLQKFYLRTSRQLRFLDLEFKSFLYTHFLESLGGLATIRAFAWQNLCEIQNFNCLDVSQKPYYLLLSIQRWLNFTIDMMIATMAVILIVLVVELRGAISPGFMGLALLNVMNLGTSMKAVITYWTSLETSIGSVSRVIDFMANTVREDCADQSRPLPENWPSEGSVEVRDVTASYRTGEPVLKNINMSISAGQKIGICGRTGSGKSSLALCMLRMLELDSGSIIIDGISLDTAPPETVRVRFATVAQDPYTFPGTVKANSDPTELLSEERIIDALKKVKLWNVIEEKGGLAADIDSLALSLGQKQLFCFARAMLKDSKIIILDEIMSSVDADTEAIISNLIRTEFIGHTIISISHKLESIIDFDKVAVIQDGQLVEFDSPENLLSFGTTAFKKLYETSKGNKVASEALLEGSLAG